MTAREHVARTRKRPCICGCGPGGVAHHVDSPRCDWAVVPMARECHQPDGCGHARGLGRRELGYLREYLHSLPYDYAERVREGIRAAWARRLETRAGARYRRVLE